MIKFTDIPTLIEKTLVEYEGQEPENIDTLILLDAWARETASKIYVNSYR